RGNDGEVRGNDGEGRNDGGAGEVPGPGNRLPVAKELGETSLMLLVHPTLTAQNIEDTIRVVKDVICRATK
ncbi:MAG: 4-keto-6-deoxy-N-Acetyl-D-hexosaminyl-(Lipid carrier) aminotransferase, partial [Candidatus Rifleibacterium amylolyticum]